MKILLIHTSFPAQFRYLAQALGRHPQHEVLFITTNRANTIEGVQKIVYDIDANKSGKTDNNFNTAQQNGIQVFYNVQKLLKKGFEPDVIYAHAGYGVSMFIKQLLPNIPLVSYCEWFFDPCVNIFGEHLTDHQLEFMHEAQAVNAVTLLDLQAANLIITPSLFQKQQLPEAFHQKVMILHDGIDTEQFRPSSRKENLRKQVLNQLNIPIADSVPIVTYVSRGLEPVRGFSEFTKALAQAQKRHSGFETIIVGSENPHYGPSPDGYKNYRKKLWETQKPDRSRIHLTGLLPTDIYRSILKISDLHIYLTRPFVLSWSFLEAMSSGCRIIASDTPPVAEFIENGVEADLVPLYETEKLATRLLEGLNEITNNPQKNIRMRKNARKKIVKSYSLKKLLPRQLAMLQAVSKS